MGAGGSRSLDGGCVAFHVVDIRDAVHQIVHAYAAFPDIPFGVERGELVGDDPDPPAGLVRLRAGLAVRENLGGSLVLVALAEGTECVFDRRGLVPEVRRPLGALLRDNHPPSYDGVLAQFRHLDAAPGAFRALDFRAVSSGRQF